MKKILLIGKFNTVLKDINNYLNKYFHVQVCIDSHNLLKDMLTLNRPDLAIISLIGMNEENRNLFNELKYNYSHTPVICIGTASEQSDFNEYFKLKQFHILTRPIYKDKILETVNELLHLTFDNETGIIRDEINEKKSILLVDDNVFHLRTLHEILKYKYDVRMATSGMNALTLIGKKKPDIIFLDYDMPMCDGKMTLQMIREIEEVKDIPVVFFTGVSDKEHIQDVLKLRPAGYLLKPASTKMIYKTIDRILKEVESV